MPTTDEQIEAMRSMCIKLETEDLVGSASVDDWGRFGNFQVLIVPTQHDRYTTGRIKAIVKRSIPKGAHLREVFGPDPIRVTNPYTRKTRTIGYSRDYWVIDIDYQVFNPESNTFCGAHQAAA